MKFVETVMYELDLFKSPFYFPLDKSRDKISTKLGSFLSLMIISVLISVFFQSDFFLKQNPTTLSQNKAISYSPKIELKATNFKLFFGIYDTQLKFYKIDPSLFSLDCVQMTYLSTLTSNERFMNITSERKKISPCFYKETSNYGYCVDEDATLEGYLTENKTKSISIRLFRCNNATSNNSCKSEKEFISFFQNKKLAVLYQNNNFNFNDHKNPIYQSVSLDYIYIDPTSSKNLNVFIKKAEFTDYDGFFFQKPKVSETYVRDYTELDYFPQDKQSLYVNAFAKIAFWSSSNIEENVRTYQKIDQVFANLTGIANFLMLICFFLVKSRQNLHLKQYLMVGLYDYVKEKEQKSNFSSLKCTNNSSAFTTLKRENDSSIIAKETSSNVSDKMKEISSPLPLREGCQKVIQKIEGKDFKDSFILERFSVEDVKQTKKKEGKSECHPLNLNILKFFKIKFKIAFKFPLNHNEKLFLKFEEEYYNTSNLKSIFKGMQDIDKIKVLIMTEEQLKIFESMPNPALSVSQKAMQNSDFFRVFALLRTFTKEKQTQKTTKKDFVNMIADLKESKKISKMDMKFLKYFT